MFGLNEISWGNFIQVIIYMLCAWYLIILVIAWIRDKNRQQEQFFENCRIEEGKSENLQTIKVSSKDFPTDIISIIPIQGVPLQTSFYEETGLDEGYGIDHFIEGKDSMLPVFMENIQYQ
jgi:hypothetical protein